MGGIILAGGKSSRMGQDKALLPLGDGRNLLEYSVDLLRPLVDRLVVVADRADKYTLLGTSILADLYPQAGPVGGIATGLATLGDGSHLVVACDMPQLNRSLLRLLLSLATSEWDVVVPELQGRLEPLCAVYRHTALPKLQAFLATDERAAHKAVQCLKARHVLEAEIRAVDPQLATFANVNTPEDWQKFSARINKKRADLDPLS